MARRKTGRRAMSDINMVPFIDIMMVLLVAFMVSAPMLTQGVKVELPEVTNKPLPQSDDQETVVVSVKADGSYFMDIGGEQDQSKSLQLIQEKVSTVVAARPGIQVLVRGDRNVAYGAVMELMAGLQGAGVNNVGLITDPAPLDEK